MSLTELGLDETATEADVKARFRELAKEAHPDQGGSAEAFHLLKAKRDAALQELQFGHSISRARLQMSALREAAKGTTCPRCDGTGVGMRRQVGFREFKTVCKLCLGKGKL
jgi:DnaJ-class molecular chaperone